MAAQTGNTLAKGASYSPCHAIAMDSSAAHIISLGSFKNSCSGVLSTRDTSVASRAHPGEALGASRSDARWTTQLCALVLSALQSVQAAAFCSLSPQVATVLLCPTSLSLFIMTGLLRVMQHGQSCHLSQKPPPHPYPRMVDGSDALFATA